jgi:rsbT antagonist protein RsbS
MSVGDAQQIPMQLSRGCVVASLQIDLSEDVIARFRKDLLEFLHSTGAHSVILDVSGLDVIDGNDFNALKLAMSMAQLMGAHSIVSGLKPGVVSSIIELGVETRDVNAALDLDDAFDVIERLRAEAARSDSADSGAGDA